MLGIFKVSYPNLRQFAFKIKIVAFRMFYFEIKLGNMLGPYATLELTPLFERAKERKSNPIKRNE